MRMTISPKMARLTSPTLEVCDLFPPHSPHALGCACRLSHQTACQLSHELSHPLTGVYYLAAVPFLLFFLAYAFGAFDFGYGRGNF